MRIFSQTKLLLWKNIVLRYRRPGILILEVIWPVLVVGIIAIMRMAVPPSKFGNCHYQPRAMPSQGAIPFLQTYLCNIDNPCYTSDQKMKSAFETSQEFSAMTENLGPLLGSDEIIDVLNVSNKTSNVYTMIKKAVGSKDLLAGLEDVMNISSYFRDPDKVKSILVDDYKLMSEAEADALMGSSVNVGQLTTLTGTPDFNDIACHPDKIAMYVQFPRGVDVKKTTSELSSSLCNVTDDKTTGLANLMIRELNFTTVMNALKLMEEVKETFLDEHNIMSYSFEMVAQMFEVVTGSDEVMKLLGTFTGLPDVASFIRKIPQFVEGFQDFDSTVAVIKDIISNLEPLMTSLQVDDSPIWRTVKDAVRLGENFMKLADGKWNGTSEEFMQPMKSFLQNIEDMSQDDEGRVFIAFFQFITKIDIVKAYDEVIYTQGLSESTVKSMLNAFQEMLEQMSLWDSVMPMARINEHFLDIMALLTDKSIELRRALKDLLDTNDILKNEIRKIFKYGPDITLAVLNAFVNNDVFTAIANEEMYHDVCRLAMRDLQNRVPSDVYNDIQNTLCQSNEGDLDTEMNNLFKSLKLSEIYKVINDTIGQFEVMYQGEFYRDDFRLEDIYDHYVRFTTALNDYLYDNSKWYQIFEGFYVDDIDINERGWEPVTDMLDENFLTTLALGTFQIAGKAFADSPLADEFSPMIHVMSEMVKLVYETMSDVNAMTSRETPMMQLANMVTKYSPELVDGVTYMLDTNSDMIFKLLSSEDPLQTFCGDRFLYKMNFPNYVPTTDLDSLICNTDWDAIVAEMAKPAQRIEAMIPKFAEITKMDSTARYDIETDWIQLTDYSERLFDMLSMGQILGIVDMRTTTVEIFGQLDLSRMEDTLESVNRLMEKLMTQDMMMAMEISYRLLELMEDGSSEMSLTDMMKASMVAFEATIDQMIASVNDPQGINSMTSLLSSLPPNVRDMVILMSKAYPQFVSAAADIMYDPSKLTARIMSLELRSPDCVRTFVSDYLSLPRDSDVHRFEAFLCELNMTQFINELFQAQFSAFIGGNSLFTMNSNEPKDLPEPNWRGMQDKLNEFNRLVMANPGANMALTPFNTTDINLAWDRFYSAADSVAMMDPTKMENLIADVIEILSVSVDNSNDWELQNFFYNTLYLNTEVMKALINELSAWNTSSPVILVDYLGSTELKKLTALLVASPDVNAVGVATLYRLMSAPQKAKISMDFDAMCNNLTLFSDVFVVSASATPPQDLQRTICQGLASVNITLIGEQFMRRPLFKALENAMRVLEEDNGPGLKRGLEGDLMKNSETLNGLIEHLALYPPTVKLTATDDAWMNAEVYAKAWEQLGSQLEQMMNSRQNDSWSENWDSMVSHLAVETLKSLPEASQIFGYIDAIVDVTLSQLDSTSGDFFETYRQYPNTSVVIDLLNHAPGALQTVLYTVLRQSQKLGAWPDALQSWDGFCMTPADTLFSVPPGLKFSMADFKNKMCSIDLDALLLELGQSQRSDLLGSVFSGDGNLQGDAATTEKKLKKLLDAFTQHTTSASGDDMADTFNLRLFNETVWQEMGKRISTWLNSTANDLMSPEKFSVLVASSLRDSIAGLSPEGAEMLNKGFAVADVVVGELLDILKSKSLDEAFKDLPTMKPFIYLLNSVPELFETLLYTGTLHPAKISMKLQGVQSFEGFCANHPEEIFSVAPGSSFDPKQWMNTLCSINDTLLDQLMNYKTATHIQDIVENSLDKPVNLTDLVGKTEKLMNVVQQGIPLNERVFDEGVWNAVMENINSWMEDFGKNQQLSSQIERSLSMGVIGFLQSMPETREALYYIDAVLGILGRRIDNSRADIKQAFDGFPTIINLLQLLEQSPEIIETVLYTVITQPHQTAAWSSAMQSWPTFCSTPPASIMTVPSGSNFDVAGFLAKLCTVDIDQLVRELNTYQGAERIQIIAMGNSSVPFNATATMEKMSQLFGSIEDLVTDPTGGNVPDLRLLDASVWDKIGKRMETWLNQSAAAYGSEMNIVDMINQVYSSTLAQIPEARDVFTKMLAVTGVISDQMIDYLQSGYINSTLGNSVTTQTLVDLANYVPEVIEIMLYTGLKEPQKLSMAANAFISLETLCRSSPDDLFSIPPDMTFDLKGWFAKLCTLNLTDVEHQLSHLKSAQDIESIINGASGSNTSITSVVAKIDKLMKLFGDEPNLHDRILNEAVWAPVMSRLEQWLEDPAFLNPNSLLSEKNIASAMDQVYASLAQIPEARDVFTKMLAVTRVITDQMIIYLQSGYINSTMADSATLQGLVDLAQNIPEIIDVMLYTSQKDPQKLSTAVNAFMSLETLCRSSPADLFSIPPDMTFDLNGWFARLCKLNVTDVENQAMQLKTAKDIESILSGTSGTDANITSVVARVDQLVKLFEGDPKLHDRFFDESLWSEVMSRLQQWTENPNFFNPDFLMSGVREVFNAMAQLQQVPGLRQSLQPVTVVMHIVENMMDNVLHLGNKTSIQGKDLFAGWRGMENAMKFIQTPGVLDTLLASAGDVKKFMAIASEEGLKDFCDPATDPSKFLTRPSNNGVDLQKVKAAFCDIDIDGFMNGVDSFINITALEEISDGSATFDWKAFGDKINEFSDLVSQWEKRPPTFDLPPQWMNESYWQNLIDTSLSTLPEKMTAKEQIVSIVTELGPLLDTEGFKQVGMILNKAVDILNINIRSMQGARFTLGSLIESVPALKALFESVGVDSHTLRSFALAPIKNTDLFLKLFISDNVQNDFCNTDKWKMAIDFPADFDTSGLVQTICSGDWQAILNNMQDKFNLTSTLNNLMNYNASSVKDWTDATGKIFDLVDNFELLFKNPPTFNADETLSILSKNYNMTNLFKLTSAFSVLSQLFNQSSNGGVGDMMSQTSKELENIVGMTIGVLDNVLARVKIQNGRLDLAALFAGVPEVQQIISGVLDMKPDPLSGLFAVALKADKVSDFMSWSDDPSKLEELFCDKKTFENVFHIRQDVDVNKLLAALCNVDFDQIAQKLQNNFVPDDSSASGFDMEQFSHTIEDIVSQLTNLIHLQHVTYNGTDLSKVFVLNSSRLMGMWEEDSFGNVPQEYVALATQILNSVLKELNSTDDVRSLSTSFKFIVAYLKSFNSFLRSVKDQPIRLSVLLNSTEVGAILNPILNNPNYLRGLVDMTVDINKLSQIIEGPSPETVLCSEKLFEALNIPSNEIAPFKDLQSHVCSTNGTVLLWQTIMFQADGYFLNQQLAMLEKEVADGRGSINTTAVAAGMEEMIGLMQTIIGQYVDGSRSFADLVDLDAFRHLLENTQKNIADKLLEASKHWSVDMADIILPRVLDQQALVGMSKALNTINLFMNLTIVQLRAMNDGSIDVSDFFMKADGLQAMIEAYIRLGTNIAPAWANNEFDVDKMRLLFNDTLRVSTLCQQQDGISQYIASGSPPSQSVKDLSTVVCSLMGAAMSGDVQKAIGYNQIGDMLMSIWNARQANPDYSTMVRNVETFTDLIQELATKSNDISSNLLDGFNFQDTMDSIQNIAQNPQMIFQLLKLLGLAVDEPLGQDKMAVKSLSQMNSFVLMPAIRFFEAMRAKGLTVTNMADNPNAFLDMLSVLVDFDFHSAAMTDFVIKPRLSTLSRRRGELCSPASAYSQNARSRLYIMPDLPASVDDVFSMICTHNASTWLDHFQQMGFTNTQIMVVLDRLLNQENVLNMHVEPFRWTDLMSSLEKLSALISDSGIDSQSKMADVHSAWNATKDILFQKGFNSLFSYLELVEVSSPPLNGDWMVFKQFMRFLSSVMETIDSNVQRVTDKGHAMVQLKDALPDPHRVADVLSRVVGGQNAAELLATSVDPIQFFRLSMYDSWKDICNGTTSITTYFYFPDGTHVDALTKSLCKAVTERTNAFDEMLSLFGAKDMFKQLDMLLHRDWNSSNHESVYDRTHAAMMHLIATLEKAQHSMVDAGSIDAYLQPILMVVQNLQQQQSFGLCDAMVMYLNETRDYSYFHDVFSHMFTAFNLGSRLAKVVPDMDDLACSLNDRSEISIKNFISKLEDLGVIGGIEKAVDDFVSPQSQLQCAAPLTFSETVMEVINATMVDHQLDTDRMHRCMEDSSVKFRNILSSTTRLLDFIKELVGAMQTPAIQRLLNDPELISAFNFFVGAIDVDVNVLVKFEDLFVNKSSASAHLTDVLGIPRAVAAAIMNSTVNPDSTNLFEDSEATLEKLFCDPPLLSRILKLPVDSGVNMTDISRMICTSQVSDTVKFLKNISATPDQIAEKSGETDLMTIVVDLTTGLANLVTDFDDVMRLFVDLTTKQDIDVLEGHVDLIDDIIQGDVMERFGVSLKEIFDAVKPFFSKDRATQSVIRDVEKVLDGIIAINVIVKGPLVDTLEVRDLVQNDAALREYLITDLNFSPELADTVLRSVFSSKVFFGLEEQQKYSCQEAFAMILVMNGTGVSPLDVSREFCKLDDQELTGLVDKLKMELDIGDMIVKYVSYTTGSVLASTNMSRDELSDMVMKIDKSQVVIQQATNEFKNAKNGSQILDIFSGSADAFTSLDQLTPLMCGESVEDIFDTDFGKGIIVSSTDTLQKELHKGFDHNLDDLPNEFCVGIYESIRSSEIGSIIWAYVKPIMRGKLLYTPDNEITRAIIAKANHTFEVLAEVNAKSTVWANQADNLKSMTIPVNETEGLKDALENDFIKGLLESTVGVDATSVLTGLDALQSNNFDADDLTALQSLAEVIANYTSCIDLDRFVPMASERELELEAFRLRQSDTFWAGIVFENADESVPSSGKRKRQAADTEIPKHVTYKIRMDVDNVMDTNRLKSGIYKMTAEDSFIEDMRYLRGFIYIQDIVDNAIISFHKNPVMETPGFMVRQMPFPCHHYDSFVFMLGSYLIPIMMTFVFLASIGTATNNLIYDRENGQEQTLQVMGMMSGLNFMSWFVSTMTVMTVVCAALAVMLKYTDVFIYSNPFIIFLFLLTFCFSSTMLLYMVSAFFNRTTLAILFVLMVYLVSYLPFILVVSLELEMEPWQKNLACLASTTAFSFGSHNMGYLEESGLGVQWSNIKEEGAKDYSMHWACMMMLIDSAIYLVVGWYIRHVKPGKYGVSKPWYFPLLPSFWCSCFGCGGSPDLKYLARNNPEHPKGSLFEEGPPDHEVGIKVNDLSKSYGKNKVLHNLTIDFYEGQISCLLGHNGAAKTTVLKLLCGILEPSTGSVLLNGRKPGSAKHSLGICPQQNALFDYMSVLEHMEFYSSMKGSTLTVKRMVEIRKLLKDVDLWHVKNVSAGDLSFGMKRRLCVALAFVGDSKTVVLDEPTSGIDPHARKNIWNLISSNRAGRTILLSTHHLDEADILSDRIAILHKGRLLCSGSPTFLKRRIGGGYKLTISKFANADVKEKDGKGAQPDSEDSYSIGDAAILSYIHSMSPTARISESMGTEMVVELPKDESLMSVPLPAFFQDLDARAKDLGIANYGLTDTKVEDIFLQLTMDMDQADKDAKEGGVVNQAMVTEGESTVTMPETLQQSSSTGPGRPRLPSDSNLFKPGARMHHDPTFQPFDQQQSVDTKKRRTGSALARSQMMALLVKRFHHYRRNWRILLTCILFPLLAFMIAIGFSTIRPDEGDQKPLVLDPVMYGKNTYTFLKQNADGSSKAAKLADTFRKSRIGVGTSCMENIDLSHREVHPRCSNGSDPYDITKPLYIIRCKEAMQEYVEIEGQTMKVEQQNLPNQLYLQNIDDYNIPNYILRTFRDYKDERFGGWSIEDAYETDDPAEYEPYVWFNSKGYHAMPSFFSAMSNGVLRANLPSYENAEEFGITTINHPLRLGRSPLTLKTLENDAADAGISIMVVLAFSFIPCGFILYIINERIQKEKQLQQISGVGTFMYWMVSWLWDTFVYLIAVGVAVAIVAIFQTDSFYIRDNLSAFAVILILYGWAMIPYIYLVSRLFKSASTAYLVTFCINLFLAMATVVSLLVMQLFRDDKDIWETYKICRYAFLVFPQFALGQGLMDMVAATVKYKLFLRFDEDFYDDPYDYDITGYKLIAMALFGFVFFILNLMAEKVHARSLRISKDHSETSSKIDEDVAREKERIQGGPRGDLLRVNDLSKVYRRGWKKFAAVDHINFGVQEGESFGLLGVNGAGKTTTFRMLTGDLGSSGGTVMFNGRKISSHDRHFGQSVGYCPQEGGLDAYLTGTETLHFHARLRGFDGSQTEELVNQLLTRLGLQPYAKKPVHAYSEGTKRKLALAVAMLGDPPILYLDEPTTGMDAATRRQAWKCIAKANLNGQSVILTSHTMDECDALCGRIAIMVNGQIKCIGSPQHLKNKFGDGYTAVIHSQKDNLGSVSNFFINQFPGSIIRTKHHSSIEVMIPHSCGILADILAVLQRAQQEGMIEYYSLSQTTLDSVFVSFAQEQTDSFEEGTGTYSSSIEDKSYSARSSVSSERPPSYDGHSTNDKKDNKDPPYVFSNPQFVVAEEENEIPDEPPRPRYVSNITLAAEMARAQAPNTSDSETGEKLSTRL